MLKDYDKSVKKIIPIPNGLGDNIVFYKVLCEIIHIYGNREIIIGTIYPEVYQDNPIIKTIDISEAIQYEDIERYNVYKFMALNKWNRSIIEAYREMLLKDEKNYN